MIINHVPLSHCAQVWPDIEAYFIEACKLNDDYTIDQIKGSVCTGNWMLLILVEDNKIHGAITVNFINMPNARVAFVTAIGGRLISSKDTYRQLAEIVKQFGATKIQGAVKESIARLWGRYGFKECYRIVEVNI